MNVLMLMNNSGILCKLYLRYSTRCGKSDPSVRSQRHSSLF